MQSKVHVVHLLLAHADLLGDGRVRLAAELTSRMYERMAARRRNTASTGAGSPAMNSWVDDRLRAAGERASGGRPGQGAARLRAYGLAGFPLLGAEVGERGREDAVLFLEDVVAQHVQRLDQPVRPGRVGQVRAVRLDQHRLDAAVLVLQRGDLLGEFGSQ